MFTDESKFNIFGSDGRVNVWRKPGEELKLKNMRGTVKHGGGHVMVWGCMSASGVGNLHFIEGNMDKWMYLDLLKKNVKESATKLGIQDTFKFYQDNDRKHTAHVVREWLLSNCPRVIKKCPTGGMVQNQPRLHGKVGAINGKTSEGCHQTKRSPN